jgi:hypothetical protein
MEVLDDARHALLRRLIDHAPMFPPASLAVDEALAEDARATGSEYRFMLGRLVWPASSAESLPPERDVSLVLDTDVPEGIRVDAVEARDRADLASLSGLAREVYVEVPIDDGLEERLDALAAAGLRAKVRCGGAAVPSDAALARFVRACRVRGLGFKATAGLHHAVRTNGEHGLLNLLAATVFEGHEDDALAERDATAFDLTQRAFAWRGHTASAAELERARRERLHSIGSCSFFEPVAELEALGVLPP